MKYFYLLGLVFSLPLRSEVLASKIVAGDALRSRLGITNEYLTGAPLGEVRVAIISSGYPGNQNSEQSGDGVLYLPAGTSVWQGGKQVEANATLDWDGRRFGQLIHGILSSDGSSPLLSLYAVDSPSEFRSALEEIQAKKVDVVLCTVLFPYFGNFDGSGPINNLIEDYTDRGGLWIQSVGAFHQRVIKEKFPAAGAKFDTKLQIKADETPVTLTLSWRGFSPSGLKTGTRLDLDMTLAGDVNGKIVELGKSDWKQVTENPDAMKHQTNVASEQIQSLLDSSATPYVVSVWNRTEGVPSDREFFRLTVTSPKKVFPDLVAGTLIDPILLEKPSADSILIPADSVRAVSVGSTYRSDSRGLTEDKRPKPELTIHEAQVSFSDNQMIFGSDVAAAELAAVATLLKARTPYMSLKPFRELVASQRELMIGADKKGVFLPSLSVWKALADK